MTKAKSKATILVPDGAGGMAPLKDRRFDNGDWPIAFEVPKEQADTWLQYLMAECSKREWQSVGLSQIEAAENSGSITILTGAVDQPQLAVVWERKQNGPLQVRSGPAGATDFPIELAQKLFECTNEKCRSGAKNRYYLRWQLEYDGLPWRGELRLGDDLRLGPSSIQDEKVLFAPRVIQVDSHVDGIDRSDAQASFAVLLRELSVFFSVVMRKGVKVTLNNGHRVWTWQSGPDGKIETDLRNAGYWESKNPTTMPSKHEAQTVPLHPIPRPDIQSWKDNKHPDDPKEQWLPSDIHDLWSNFKGLADAQQRQFLQAGSLWQASLLLDNSFQTTKFTMMVAACEALKPLGDQFDGHNIYGVVEALLGATAIAKLNASCFKPQPVRSEHVHRGKFQGSEFIRHLMMSSYKDPSFDEAYESMTRIAPAALVAWLMRGGAPSMKPKPFRKKKSKPRSQVNP